MTKTNPFTDSQPKTGEEYKQESERVILKIETIQANAGGRLSARRIGVKIGGGWMLWKSDMGLENIISSKRSRIKMKTTMQLWLLPVLLFLSSCDNREKVEFPVLPSITRIEVTINDTATAPHKPRVKQIVNLNQVKHIVMLADKQRSGWTPSGGVQHFNSDIELVFYSGQKKQREWIISPDGFSEGFGQSGNLSAIDNRSVAQDKEVIKQISDEDLQALSSAIGPIPIKLIP